MIDLYFGPADSLFELGLLSNPDAESGFFFLSPFGEMVFAELGYVKKEPTVLKSVK